MTLFTAHAVRPSQSLYPLAGSLFAFVLLIALGFMMGGFAIMAMH